MLLLIEAEYPHVPLDVGDWTIGVLRFPLRWAESAWCAGSDADDDRDGLSEQAGDCDEPDPTVRTGAMDDRTTVVDAHCDGVADDADADDGDGSAVLADCDGADTCAGDTRDTAAPDNDTADIADTSGVTVLGNGDSAAGPPPPEAERSGSATSRGGLTFSRLAFLPRMDHRPGRDLGNLQFVTVPPHRRSLP